MTMTKEQELVVSRKKKDGYAIWGTTKSAINGLDAVALTKGRHFIVVNSLGFDEHTFGRAWVINSDGGVDE